MTEDKILEGFRLLRAFPELQALAQREVGRSGTSYQAVRETLVEFGNEETWAAAREALEEVRLHGRSHVFLHWFDEELGNDLYEATPDEECLLAKSFPDVSCSEIPDEVGTEWYTPKLIRRIEYDSDVRLVFASLRRARLEELVDIESILADAPEELAQRLRDADELVIRQVKHLVAYDVVVVPSEPDRPIQLWIDYFTYRTDPDVSEALVNLRRAVAELPELRDEDGNPRSGLWADPIDVGPAMERIYAANTEGRIVELAFQLPTLSRKREVAQGGTDLRTEIYHKGGVSKLLQNNPGTTPIELLEIYRVGVAWDTDANGEILTNCRIVIPGSIGLIGRPKRIYEIRATYPMSRAAHDLAVERVLAYAVSNS